MKKKLLALFLCCALSFGLVTAALITPAAADSELMIYSENVAVDTVSVPKNEKKTLAAGGLSGYYQWQIQVGGDVWANIAGATGAELEVGYALVANLLYGGTANIRCRVTGAAEEPVYSNTVTVQITDETPVSAPAQAPKAPTVISEAEPVGEPVIIPPQTAAEETPAPDAAPAADAAPANDLTGNAAPASLADPAPVNDPAPSDDGGEEPYAQTFTITINYVDNKDQQIADPWTATVMAGSTYQSVVKSPVVVGYTAEQAEITVGGENIQEDQNFTVKYTPALVKFSVKHLRQNVSNDEYTQDGDPEIRNGNTGDAVGETLAKLYPGFYSLKYDATVKIAGDESTVVEVKYDRYYYLINFNLDGGYGVEPIYARYGAPVNVGNPQKPGYTFTGWSGEIPKTMPVIENPLSFTAKWQKGTAGFTVVFWYENANDVGYSVAGTFTPADVAPGTQKSSGDYQNQSFEGRDDKHFTYNTDKVETVTVKGDGSTVLNVYYTRNPYTLKFRELDCDKWFMHTHNDNCYKVIKTITAKYDADIHSNFPIKDGDKTIWWVVPEGCQSFVPGNNLGTIDTMPGENITFEKKASESGAKIYYYVETLNGEAGDTTHNGKNYKQYVIHYQLENGTTIAEDTTGSALAGTTKTFAAKTFGMLNEGYQTGYYPMEGSHSIQMDIEGTNEYTFVYVAREKVNYTVRYLERNTETVLSEEKHEASSDAVITEKFVKIKGYAPDAYQKQLVLSADDTKNVLTFWYTKDETHAPLQKIHLIQNLTNDEYTEYQSSTNLNATIGTDYSETPLMLTGFTYNAGKSTASGTLSADGLVLKLYYDRNVYPYKFRFLVQGTTETKVADPVTGSARYQARVTQGAKEVPGYTLVLGTTNPQTIDIVAEEGNTAVNNVKIFYYVEDTVDIKYEVVGPDGCGTLDNYQNNTVKVVDGTPEGSTPTASAGFKFVGWYKDKDCTQPVDEAWIENNRITPQKTADLGNGTMGYEAATYYAKFEYDVADLTINKQGWQAIDENQSFIFDVTGPNGYYKRVVIQGSGSVTIKGLKVGTYSVTEVTDWSWRYKTADGTANSIEHEIKPKDGFVFDFTNSRENGKWLGGDAYSKNVFGTIIETDSGN